MFQIHKYWALLDYFTSCYLRFASYSTWLVIRRKASSISPSIQFRGLAGKLPFATMQPDIKYIIITRIQFNAKFLHPPRFRDKRCNYDAHWKYFATGNERIEYLIAHNNYKHSHTASDRLRWPDLTDGWAILTQECNGCITGGVAGRS